MGDIQPKTFYNTLYYLFVSFFLIGLAVLTKDVILILHDQPTQIMSFVLWPPYNLITPPIYVLFVVLTYNFSQRMRKVLKELKFR